MSMQEWYTSQTPREQFIVAATAIVGITALLYTFAFKPCLLYTSDAADE